MNVYQEKAQQACALLSEFDLDMWITYVRETAEHTDPVLKLLGPFSPTWPAAFIYTRDGEKIAISGKGDDEAIRREQVFDEVIPYTQSIKDVLVPLIERIDPQRIGINYSQSDVSADGLTYGMYLNLKGYLADTPYASDWSRRKTSSKRCAVARRPKSWQRCAEPAPSPWKFSTRSPTGSSPAFRRKRSMPLCTAW